MVKMNESQKYIKLGEMHTEYCRKNLPCCNCHCGCIAETYVNICIDCKIGYHMEDAERDAGF